MVHYTDLLCLKLNGDQEAAEIAAYLHDISVVLDVKTLPTHNVASAAIAESILSGYSVPKEKIAIIQQAIIKHTVPVTIGQGTIEEICVSNADAISQIVNPSYWLYFIFKIRQMAFEEGRLWYRNKLQINWNNLIEPAKEIIEKQYKMIGEMI